MKATLYFHARSEDTLHSKIVPKAATGEHDRAYFEFHVGEDVVIFISDEQRRQLLDVLSSAPPLPKTDAQIDAEAEAARNIPVSALPNWRGGPDAEF